MKFLLHNEEGITFPPIRPAYEEGQLLFERFRTLTPRDARDSIIGEGGTGIIHLVRDELMDRIVALKLPHENILRDPGARFDVIRETRQAIELTHPNIVRIHDFHEAKGAWAISMQYVRGRNLDEWRHEGRAGSRRSIVPYSVEQIEGWITQLCNALIYAHEDAHMVHRDIKPKNLMLERRDDGYEKLLLTDFGITQKLRLHTMMLSRVQPGANEKSTMGTLPYMPWEQIQGAPASTLDDIYAVGATIYELLTGRPPFYEGAYEQIRTQVEKVVPPTMTERLRQFDLSIHSIPDHWEETVAACLAKRPEDRPQSMREILNRLGLAGTPAPVAAPAEASPVFDNSELESLQGELHLREKEIQTLQSELETRQGELSLLQAEALASQERIASLERTIDESRTALGSAENLDHEREEQLASLRNDLSSRDEQIALTTAELGELRNRIASLETETAEVSRQRAALEAELTRAREAQQIAESDAAQKIQEAEQSASRKVAAAEDTARNALDTAEQAVRKKTAHALAQALAAAELANTRAAKLADELAAAKAPAATSSAEG